MTGFHQHQSYETLNAEPNADQETSAWLTSNHITLARQMDGGIHIHDQAFN